MAIAKAAITKKNFTCRILSVHCISYKRKLIENIVRRVRKNKSEKVKGVYIIICIYIIRYKRVKE